jgi:uncharacterized protein (UPF0147 family)
LKKNELIQQFDNIEFARKTCFQLIKEFEKVGVVFQLDPSLNDVEKITYLIAKELETIATSSGELLAQLIYSIDLPEKTVRRSFEESEDVIQELSYAFIIRAAQKIYLREKYS